MPTFISLATFTKQGIENIKDSPDRVEKARTGFQDMGAEIKAFYSVMGRYDAVVISEAPDAETAAKIALATGSLGNVRTETFRAFTEEEFRKIVSELP